MTSKEFQRLQSHLDAIELVVGSIQKQLSVLRSGLEDIAANDGATPQLLLPQPAKKDHNGTKIK